MLRLIFLLALAHGTQGCTENVTVTTTWYQPPTLVSKKCARTHTFSIPSDSYANVKVGVHSGSYSDDVYLTDDFGTRFNVDEYNPGDTVNFPSTFHINVAPNDPSKEMTLEITVTVKKRAPYTNVTQIITNANKQPTVIYLNDWAPGTYYTFTSKSTSSRVAVYVDPHFISQTVNQFSILNNVFVTEGGVNRGSIYPYIPTGLETCISKGNEITLYLAESAPLDGAILVTDYDNVNFFSEFQVQFVPVDYGFDPTGWADVDGAYGKPSAMTIIGERNGATPITVRSAGNHGDGGHWTYYSGGPVANYHVVEAPISNKMLPKTLGGTLNTFVISDAGGMIKYTI